MHSKITFFQKEKIQGISIPQKFTFPFSYQPDELTQIAVQDLQKYLEEEFISDHNFGFNKKIKGLAIGKMFGVLVIKDKQGNLGYISAFSGKLDGSNVHQKFVPPVFDMLKKDSFFKKEEIILNAINAQVELLEKDENYLQLLGELAISKENSLKEISDIKKEAKINKNQRKTQRELQKEVLSNSAYANFEQDLIKQSYRDQYEVKKLTSQWKEKIAHLETQIYVFEKEIEELKMERRERSSRLQNELFKQYSFLNKEGLEKDLNEIFKETVFKKPPAAAGECAAPKLLQYAFKNQLKPVSFAEFWWGDSPPSEVRQHKQFYAACSGKCRPILKHMLNGIELNENPITKNLAENKKLRIVFEDDHLLIINKPADLLSVPGIEVQDSVYTRLQDTLSTIEPLIVHRLDMSTSGLMVVAKTKEAHKNIQKQFIRRTVQKRYTALLSKNIEESEGEIKLPLLPNHFDRPRQMVSLEKGKPALTKWKKMDQNENSCRVHFWPITGRTHQLRVHAAHTDGLNAPIIGDDLYGNPSDRLYLHAAYLEFMHPKTRTRISFEVKEDF